MNQWDKSLVLQSVMDMLGDKRLVHFQASIFDAEQQVLSGEVDTRETYDQVSAYLADSRHRVALQLQILHEQVYPDARYGMVVVPVCDIRKDGRFRSERVHQLIFGQWVQVLRISSDYLMVKDCTHGYLGYTPFKNVELCHQDRYVEITSLPHWMVKSRFASTRSIGRSNDLPISHPFEHDLRWLPLGAHIYTDNQSEERIDAVLPYTTVSVSRDDCQPFQQRPIRHVVDMSLPLYSHVPYLWGGASTYGTDCSGFVMRLFEMSGRTIPRDADQQEAFLEEISLDHAQFGDLCFFPGHVGLFLGEGWMVHANVTLGGVTINQILQPRDSYEQYLRRSLSKVGRWVE